MGSLLGSIGLAYLAVTGTVATSCVVGRGLVKAARQAARGNFGEAGTDIASAVAAPAVIAYKAAAGLAGEVVDGAMELIGGLLTENQQEQMALSGRNGQRACC